MKKIIKKALAFSLLLFTCLTLSNCKKEEKILTGAAVGAATGGVIGGVSGGGTGAAVGVGVGAVTGGLIGSHVKDKDGE